MRYTIVERNSLAELTEQVNEMISQGWLPTGGVAPSVIQMQDRHEGWDNQLWYAQAMTNANLPYFK